MKASKLDFFVLIIFSSLFIGCSAIVSGDPIYRSIWDNCFVGSFIDPDKASISANHERSLVVLSGLKEATFDAPWESLSYQGLIVDEGKVKGTLTLTLPPVCDPECRTPEVNARDARTGDDEVTVNFFFLRIEELSDGEIRCNIDPRDTLELSYVYVLEGNPISETIASTRQ